MEGVKIFLESSTIHGFSHIAISQRLVKLFWIGVVISGFIGASVIIYQSFQDWHESPVKTTIETHAIKEITFPKVTVCPPKNTFTNLNYDLLMVKNMTLDDETRNDIMFYAMKLLNGQKFDKIIRNLSMLQEENKYFNWYHGYTQIKLPKYHELNDTLEFDIQTRVASGVISTKNFGQIFEAKDFVGNISINVYQDRPVSSINESGNTELHFEIERNIISGMNESCKLENSEQYGYTSNFTMNAKQLVGKFNWLFDRFVSFTYERFFGNKIFNQNSFDQNPGFRMKWFYTGDDVIPSVSVHHDGLNVQFRR